MEFINNIELCGIVGNTAINNIQGSEVVRFSLVVEQAYNSKDGVPVIDSTWFNCTAWKSKTIQDLSKIKKGAKLHLTGRVKLQRLLTPSENERYIWEVICKTIEVVD